MGQWLMTWATAEPLQVTAFVICAVFAVLAVVCGVAAWREWQTSKRDEHASTGFRFTPGTQDDLTDMAMWKKRRRGDWGREGGWSR